MNPYFEYLEKNFPVADGEVSLESVSKLSVNQLIDKAKELSSLITESKPKNKSSIFNHCASTTLGGGRGSCWSYDCREERLNQIARIAALYSDKIYINNYFSYFDSHNIDNKSVHSDFYDDLSLIYQIRPLLENGIISIVREVPVYCPSCMAGSIAGDHNNIKRIETVNKAEKNIAQEYFDLSTVFFVLDEDGICGFSLEAPSYGQVWCLRESCSNDSPVDFAFR